MAQYSTVHYIIQLYYIILQHVTGGGVSAGGAGVCDALGGHIYTHLCMHIYIYIYRERER